MAGMDGAVRVHDFLKTPKRCLVFRINIQGIFKGILRAVEIAQDHITLAYAGIGRFVVRFQEEYL